MAQYVQDIAISLFVQMTGHTRTHMMCCKYILWYWRASKNAFFWRWQFTAYHTMALPITKTIIANISVTGNSIYTDISANRDLRDFVYSCRSILHWWLGYNTYKQTLLCMHAESTLYRMPHTLKPWRFTSMTDKAMVAPKKKQGLSCDSHFLLLKDLCASCNIHLTDKIPSILWIHFRFRSTL